MAQRGCEILLHRSASYDLYKDKACRRGFLHPTTFPLFCSLSFVLPLVVVLKTASLRQSLHRRYHGRQASPVFDLGATASAVGYDLAENSRFVLSRRRDRPSTSPPPHHHPGRRVWPSADDAFSRRIWSTQKCGRWCYRRWKEEEHTSNWRFRR